MSEKNTGTDVGPNIFILPKVIFSVHTFLKYSTEVIQVHHSYRMFATVCSQHFEGLKTPWVNLTFVRAIANFMNFMFNINWKIRTQISFSNCPTFTESRRLSAQNKRVEVQKYCDTMPVSAGKR